MVVAKHATTTQYGAIEEKTQTHPVDDYNLDLLLITLISPLWIILTSPFSSWTPIVKYHSSMITPHVEGTNRRCDFFPGLPMAWIHFLKIKFAFRSPRHNTLDGLGRFRQ